MIRIVVRSLTRNRWRSALTVGGVALGVALVVWMAGLVDAYLDMMAQGATAGQLGQLQIHDTDYADKPDFYETLAHDEAVLDSLAAVPGVRQAAPRVHGFGLIGHEKRSQVAVVLGVDPTREPQVTSVVKGITKGRWLSAKPPPDGEAREVVLAKGMANQLGAEIGTELVLMLQAADGSMGNDKLTVVGILRSGNAEVDRTFAYVHIADAQFVMAQDGRMHEIALSLDKGADLDLARDGVASLLPEGATLRTWKELVPDLVQVIELSQNSMWMMYAIIYLLIGLGILNTQRMSALERRREFGVLVAIGTTPRRLAWQVILESVFLSTVGALVGLLIGGGLVAYHAANGFDMGAFASSGSGEGVSWLGISFDELLYFRFDPKAFINPVIWIFFVSFLCGLWPALKSARANPVTAISGRAS